MYPFSDVDTFAMFQNIVEKVVQEIKELNN